MRPLVSLRSTGMFAGQRLDHVMRKKFAQDPQEFALGIKERSGVPLAWLLTQRHRLATLRIVLTALTSNAEQRLEV